LPILPKELISNFRVSTFHSKADNIDDLDPEYFTLDELDEIETFGD